MIFRHGHCALRGKRQQIVSNAAPPPSFRLPHLPYSRQSPWLFFLSQAGFGSGNEKRVGSIREEVLKYWIGYFRVPPFLSGISRYIAIVGYFQVFQVLREVVKNGQATVRGGQVTPYSQPDCKISVFWVYPNFGFTSNARLPDVQWFSKRNWVGYQY